MKTQNVFYLFLQKPLQLAIACTLIFTGCQSEHIVDEVQKSEHLLKMNTNTVVEVSSDGFNFHAPDQIPFGWTTFKYTNESHHPHFFVLEKMPEGYDVSNSLEEVVPSFQEGMYYIMEGDLANAFAAFGNLPAWYSQVVIIGGPGMVSPETSAVASAYLDPGTYVIECYVKSPDGTFHTSLGMIDQIIVTDEDNNQAEPQADFEVTISSANGITLPSKILPGQRTFAVHFQDQTVHDNFLGHDVHLVKLDDNADLTKLDAWMNWAAPAGLAGHGPEGVTFIGGTQEAPAGTTTYFSALLKPGNYALVAEVPSPTSKGMLQTFTVPSN